MQTTPFQRRGPVFNVTPKHPDSKTGSSQSAPSELESRFYSHYFVVPKTDGCLRPVLDLRPINQALHKCAFRMTTLKQLLAQVRPGDWITLVDLKDAHFHIQIVMRRFALEGKAYHYAVLPFGLALAPHTFSKCVDAAFILSQRE